MAEGDICRFILQFNRRVAQAVFSDVLQSSRVEYDYCDRVGSKGSKYTAEDPEVAGQSQCYRDRRAEGEFGVAGGVVNVPLTGQAKPEIHLIRSQNTICSCSAPI